MAWERSIPFGYRMERTKIVREQSEADTVKEIFTMYLNGHSLSQIATAMTTQGVRYHAHTDEWNKHMVKRILDNDRYLGDEDYPQLIDAEDFLAVRLLKTEKKKGLEPCPETISSMSKYMVCAECGSKMRRHTHKRKKPRWICQNEDCRHTAIITDDELIEALERCYRQLTLSPQLLEVCAPDAPFRSMDAIRLENELTAAFNRGTESAAYMKTLIFAAAAERYRTLPDLTLQYKTRALQGLLEEDTLDFDFMSYIRERATRRILLHRGGGVAVELISGQTITDGEEVVE